MTPKTLLQTCFVLAAFLWQPASQAASSCVSDAVGLHAALAQAEINGEDDEIRLEEGVVFRSDTGFSYSSAEPHALSLSGGWTASCTIRIGLFAFSNLAPDASHAMTRILDIDAGDGPVRVEALRIVRGNPEALTRGGGLRVRTAAGDISIDRNIFSTNTAASNGAVYASTDLGDIRARNNLVADNSQLSGAAIALVALDGTIYASGNTVHGNVSSVADGVSAGLSVMVNAADANRRAYLSNNVIRDNDANGNPDLEAFGANSRYYNAIRDQGTSGDAPTEVIGEITEDPRLCLDAGGACGITYVPLNDSPLLDAGANLPYGGGLSLDLHGNPRIAGAQVDIGAIENVTVVFADGFE